MLCADCGQPKKEEPCKSAFCAALGYVTSLTKPEEEYKDLFPLLCEDCAKDIPLHRFVDWKVNRYWLHVRKDPDGSERYARCKGQNLRRALYNAKANRST